MLFAQCFLQRRMPGVPRKAPSLYLRPWLQCVCATWAMACSFTRISDHRHHPHDVLAGFVLGLAFAGIAVRRLLLCRTGTSKIYFCVIFH